MNIKESIDRLVIKRSEWTGVNPLAGSALLTGSGKKCCLGFYALECGAPAEKIAGFGWINRIRVDNEDYVAAAVYNKELNTIKLSPTFEKMAADINDDPNMPLNEKEAKIIELFKTVNCEVTFCD